MNDKQNKVKLLKSENLSRPLPPNKTALSNDAIFKVRHCQSDPARTQQEDVSSL